jgi:anti-sigma B factor antagonist
LEITTKEALPGVVVLEMKGQLQLGVPCTRLQIAVEDAIQAKQTRVVLDLTNVSKVDSAGLGKIVNCLSALRVAGGAMNLAGPSSTVMGLLKLTRVDKLVKAFPTRQEAVQDLANSAAKPQ